MVFLKKKRKTAAVFLIVTVQGSHVVVWKILKKY